MCYLPVVTRKKTPSTEMVRLPGDVTAALRRKALGDDITLAEAARRLMLSGELRGTHGLLDHVHFLHDRLVRRQHDLEKVIEHRGRHPRVVDDAISALARLREDWQNSDDDDEVHYRS